MSLQKGERESRCKVQGKEKGVTVLATLLIYQTVRNVVGFESTAGHETPTVVTEE